MGEVEVAPFEGLRTRALHLTPLRKRDMNMVQKLVNVSPTRM